MPANRQTPHSNVDQTMILVLQERLSEALDLTSRAQEANLNNPTAQNPHFHVAVGQLEQQLSECATRLAHQLSAMGGHVRASSHATAQISTLPEYPYAANGSASHMNAVITSLCVYRRKIAASEREAEAVGDVQAYEAIHDVSRTIDGALFDLGAYAA